MSPEWISAISAAVSALAVITAGAFAYIRFVRGRVHRPDLSVVLKPTLALIEGLPVLRLQLVLKNVGTLQLFVDPQKTQRVTIQGADQAVWQDAQVYGDILWSEGFIAEIDLMSEEGRKLAGLILEPGETSEQSLLVPLGPDDKIAYRVSTTVEAVPSRLLGRRTGHCRWEAHIILLKGECSHG